MIIKRIIVEIGPSEKELTLDDPPVDRTLIFDRATKMWTGTTKGFVSSDGLHPGEIKIIAAIDEVRAKNLL